MGSRLSFEHSLTLSFFSKEEKWGLAQLEEEYVASISQNFSKIGLSFQAQNPIAANLQFTVRLMKILNSFYF